MTHTIEIAELETVWGNVKAQVEFSIIDKYDYTIEKITCTEVLEENKTWTPKIGEELKHQIDREQEIRIHDAIYEYMAECEWTYQFGKAVAKAV